MCCFTTCVSVCVYLCSFSGLGSHAEIHRTRLPLILASVVIFCPQATGLGLHSRLVLEQFLFQVEMSQDYSGFSW